MASRFAIETIFKGKDLLSKKMDRMISKSRKLKAAHGNFKKQLEMTNRLHSGLTTGFVAAGAAAVGASVGVWKLTEAGREFDKEMSKVRANMGDKATEKGMEALRLKAAELGATTEHTSAQAAQGLNELAKAGFTTQQQLGAIPAVLSGASAGEIEMAEAAGILTSTLAAFDMKGKSAIETTQNAQRVMDVLAVASTSTKSSISSLGESLKSVSPIAKEFGFSVEESVAMVAKMQDVGIDASEAGNSVKTMLTELTKPSAQAKRIMKEAGVSFIDSYGNMKPPKELFAEAAKLKQSLSGNAASAAAFSELVGLRGQKALTILGRMYSDVDEKGRTLTDTLRDSKGAADRLAKVKLDNLSGDVTKLGSAWDGLTVALNDSLKGSLRPLIQEFTAWLADPETKESIKFYTEKFIEWAPLLIDVAVHVGAVAAAILTVTTAMKLWAAAGVAVNAVMAMNPILLLLMAIAAAIAIVILHWDEFKLAGLMAMDALAAPLILLNNMIADVMNKFGVAMQKMEFMEATSAELDRRDMEANLAAQDKARGIQTERGQGTSLEELRGQIDVNMAPQLQGNAQTKGGVKLNVQNSGSF